jgi:hypothetical protein
MPVIRTTSSLSAWVVGFDVLLPVTTKTPLPSEAMPPAAQIPSVVPPVAQPVIMVGVAALMATTRPR